VSKKSRDRHRRRQLERRAAEAAKPTDEPQPLSQRRLEERAVRERWIDGALHDEIVERLKRTIRRKDWDIVDGEGGVQPRTNDREVNGAVRALTGAYLGEKRLELERERLGLAKQRYADRLASAERAAKTDGDPLAAGAEPPKRITIPDVDDRLEPRED
jgi:hypothetical protein